MSRIAGTSLDVDALMQRLRRERPVFHSEADFQHAFACAVCASDPGLRARLEITLRPRERLDLLITDPETGQGTAIEFKYPTASWSGSHNDEDFNLRNHSATDLASYAIVKDIQRLEGVVDNGDVQNGCLIVLTNEPSYWKAPTHGRVTNADAFRIHQDVHLRGVRKWARTAGPGTTKGIRKQIELRGEYDLAWRDYAHLEGPRGTFRYLVVPAAPVPDPAVRDAT